LFLTAVPKTEFAPVGATRSRQPQRQGTLQVGFGMPTSTGKLCALAVTTTWQSEVLPNIPVPRDFVPGFEASQGWASVRRRHAVWIGLGSSELLLRTSAVGQKQKNSR
jgi:hypothetical protein